MSDDDATWGGRFEDSSGLGIRQRQIIDAMRRNGGRLPSNWRTTSAAMRQSLDALLRRGLIEPVDYTYQLTQTGHYA